MRSSLVYIVDDDQAVREALSLLLEVRGLKAMAYPDAESFLDACDVTTSGCLVLDLRMPGMSGSQLQSELTRRGIDLPIVIVTAHGDVSSARAAFRGGAIDFIEKPVDPDALLVAVEDALSREATTRAQSESIADARARFDSLTERERQVVERTVSGLHNREIAHELGISSRTIEVYKARAMQKMGVKRIPDLVRVVMRSRGEGD